MPSVYGWSGMVLIRWTSQNISLGHICLTPFGSHKIHTNPFQYILRSVRDRPDIPGFKNVGAYQFKTVVRLDKDLKTCVEHRATLTRHERGVGTVRFAPPKKDRMLLASAADDAHIIVWKFDEGRTPMASSLEEEEESKEVWSTYKTLRGHVEDVCDLSWSRDGTKLASCGIDQSVFIWEVDTVRKKKRFS